MILNKSKYLNILKAIDYLAMLTALILAFIHPFFPIYDKGGKLVESAALGRIAIVIFVLFIVIPIFSKEITAIRKNKKPYDVKKKNNTVQLPKVNLFLAALFAVATVVLVPKANVTYNEKIVQWQVFY
ncbi:MAG: hypothetical protein SOW18_00410, partial [Peptoniphilus sp.]